MSRGWSLYDDWQMNKIPSSARVGVNVNVFVTLYVSLFVSTLMAPVKRVLLETVFLYQSTDGCG